MGGIFFGNDLLKKGSDSEMMNMLAMNFVVIFYCYYQCYYIKIINYQ